jgi:pyruvate formate lyase activating enzyme
MGDGMNRRDFFGLCARAGGLAAVPGVGRTLGRAVLAEEGDIARHPARYWKALGGARVQCQVCPHNCELARGETGTCGNRTNFDGKLITKVYGKPALVRAEAMEKGPFYHFLPATKSLGLGTAGCNLDCGYCQNWEFACSKPELTDNKSLPPRPLVDQVKQLGGKSITFTYSEGIVSAEYVLDTAEYAHEQGIRVLLKTGGYGNPEVIRDLCAAVDAVNVDFKAWDPEVYRDITTCERETMMQTIQIATEADVWLEVTNLVVPGYNDDERQVTAMAQWIIDNCGRNTPLHMSRFFPKYRFRSIDPTSRDTLLKLRKVAFNTGLRYVYLGNMGGDPAESTYCPKCWLKVIERVGFRVTNKGLDVKTGKCTKCGLKIPGVWV